MLRAYLFKTIRSPRLYIGIFGVIAICFTMFNAFTPYAHYNSVIEEIEGFLIFDQMYKIITVFAALGFTANFAEEWKSKAAMFAVARCGAIKYASVQVVVCFLCAVVTVFSGMMLFAGIYSIFLPLYCDNGNPLSQPYGVFVEMGAPILEIAAVVMVFAVSCAAWCVMGLMLSAIFPNKYIAICAPFAASYIIERPTLSLPSPLNLWYIGSSMLQWKNAFLQFIYSVGIYIALAAVCGIIFVIIVKRRFSCEIS